MATTFLPDASRALGIRIVGARGAGKSRLMGRSLIYQDFLRGTPLVVLDPIGGVIDNFLDKLLALPPDQQVALGQRLVYCDLGGHHGYVVPQPLYYRTGTESLHAVSQRYLQTVRKLNPDLQGASILGFPALQHVGTHIGMALAALGGQITDALDLLDHPHRYAAPLQAARARYPELAAPARFLLQDLPALAKSERERQTTAFRREVTPFNLDPVLQAQYGAATPGLNWATVVAARQCVLYDFRHVREDRKRFAVVWAFQQLMEFIAGRGPGRHRPLALYFDEITYALSAANAREDLLAEDFQALVARYARNHVIWCCFAHQELNQLNQVASDVFWSCGTQLFGPTSDLATAEAVASRFLRYDPHRVKKVETRPIYGSLPTGLGFALPGQIDQTTTTTEFSRDEQRYLNALPLLDLPRYTFYLGVAEDEGHLPTRLERVSIAGLDPGEYVDEALVAETRRRLAAQGRAIPAVLAEIAARQAGPPSADVSLPGALAPDQPLPALSPPSPPARRRGPAASAPLREDARTRGAGEAV